MARGDRLTIDQAIASARESDVAPDATGAGDAQQEAARLPAEVARPRKDRRA